LIAFAIQIGLVFALRTARSGAARQG
jgi:hypothetical protein